MHNATSHFTCAVAAVHQVRRPRCVAMAAVRGRAGVSKASHVSLSKRPSKPQSGRRAEEWRQRAQDGGIAMCIGGRGRIGVSLDQTAAPNTNDGYLDLSQTWSSNCVILCHRSPRGRRLVL
eukprot:scaffold21818_cov28-Tisochrysis_lutea.AAC.4